jgi:hypothetical protein
MQRRCLWVVGDGQGWMLLEAAPSTTLYMGVPGVEPIELEIATHVLQVLFEFTIA